MLEQLAAAGAAMVRLDAVGYAVKTAGTSCSLTPETLAFVAELTGWARELGLDVLVEVHAHYERQVALASAVDRVYDFALPPLVLHALHTGDAAPLGRWLEIRPANAITVLDTHDGIGVVDVGADQSDPSLAGLLDPTEIDRLVEAVHAASDGGSRLATGSAASNVDLYQVNCTFYDALGRDDARYLVARALQLSSPGSRRRTTSACWPGPTTSSCWPARASGDAAYRHHYGDKEIGAALEQPVVAALARLIRFRNAHPAFGGELHRRGRRTARSSSAGATASTRRCSPPTWAPRARPSSSRATARGRSSTTWRTYRADGRRTSNDAYRVSSPFGPSTVLTRRWGPGCRSAKTRRPPMANANVSPWADAAGPDQREPVLRLDRLPGSVGQESVPPVVGPGEQEHPVPVFISVAVTSSPARAAAGSMRSSPAPVPVVGQTASLAGTGGPEVRIQLHQRRSPTSRRSA